MIVRMSEEILSVNPPETISTNFSNPLRTKKSLAISISESKYSSSLRVEMRESLEFDVLPCSESKEIRVGEG